MYSSKPKCEICYNSKFREIIIEHTIKTRDVDRREMKIQNLPVEQCVVCGEMNLTPKSELIIDSLKEMIQKQLKESADLEKKEVSEKKKNVFLNKIVSLINK